MPTRIVQQIRAGASFAAYARQFSEASTAARRRRSRLGPGRAASRRARRPACRRCRSARSAIRSPIPGGFRSSRSSTSGRSWSPIRATRVLSLMQMTIAMPAGTTAAQAEARATELGRDGAGDGRLRRRAGDRAAARRRARLQRPGAGARAAAGAPADAARPQRRPGDAGRSARPSGSACSSCAAATIRRRSTRPTLDEIYARIERGAGRPPRAALPARPPARRGGRLSLTGPPSRSPSRWATRRASALR